MPEKRTAITPDDVKSVSEKLQGLMEDLPEDQRNVLGLILTRASASKVSEEELAKVEIGDVPLSSQLERAMGLGRRGPRGPRGLRDRVVAEGGSTITVGWKYKF